MDFRDVIPLYRVAVNPLNPTGTYAPGTLVNQSSVPFAILADNNGNLIGDQDVSADAAINSQMGLTVANFSYTLDEGNGISYRIRMLATNADAQTAAQNGLQGVVSRAQVFNGTTWDRSYALASSSDAQVPAQVGLTGTVTRNQLFNGTNWDRQRSVATNADALASATLGAALSAAEQFVYNGASWDRQRGANVFKTVDTVAAGNTAVWTPAIGKKFRLMGGIISVSGTAAALVADAIQLRDGAATVVMQFRAAVAATVTGDTQIPFDLGQGYLSSAANNVLNVNVGTALTAGGVSVNVWGVEE